MSAEPRPSAAAPALGAVARRPPAPRTGLVSALASDGAAIAADIKLAHSVFALPFALLAAFLAAAPAGASATAGPSAVDWPRFGLQLGLVVLAMVAARSAAMLANRYLDRAIDAENPRTAGRALPAGRLTPRRVLLAIGVAGAAFIVVAAAFGFLFGNWWPLALALPVLAWICAYGWLKRFTALCHLYLGSSLAISPIAAAIAVDPAQAFQPTLWLLAAMVLCWVAGFDVIYALQDVECDRRQGLHSVPSRWGVGAALWASRGLHLLALALLWRVALGDPRFGIAMTVAAAITSLLLLIEHATVLRWGTSRMALTFFTLNGVISCIIGGLGIVDVLRSAAAAPQAP
ncbi:MAG TPA: UbiA-like polyprenyltransferase [Phycisphaerales bacterium]|nr:UbiA-like polyprenyltransferase [Phycisphaerales bacterium]HMP37209.1 UbiA-like polyprenyltransferase [Phycisphaerales bacterium]